ncbi:hypothetical protein CLV78_109127 [Aliiruegeria haliotis]|uniref:Uncharacterized protein n=1 Tax=Aliiruegeria haliotis TaxID=1280846 RepID=A0A2T0RK03_9RHOB|nr:DUF5333 family protein [Aliiruegeria haliotis]PRY21514.1 hypothetical protein CLV78_109127 [Aliiruegeria haliotis]
MNTSVATSLALVVAAGTASAQDKQPAPGYFIDTIVATTTAQNIALACPTLSFELLRASRVSGKVLEQLAKDGFDEANLEATMEDPAERIRAAQTAFLDKHDLPKQGAEFEAVCAAGLAEIAEGTEIGLYLLEITGDGAIDPTAEKTE